MATRYQPIDVPRFGGGLNFREHPAAMDPSYWTNCNGFMGLDDAAEQWPTFTTIGDAVGSSGDEPVGIVRDAFNQDKMLIALETTTNNLVLVKKDVLTGANTTLTRVGGTDTPRANEEDLLTTAFLNGYQVLATGMVTGGGAGRSSLLRYAGGSTYDTIDPPASKELRAAMITSFGGHIVAASVMFDDATSSGIPTEGRRICWSAGNDESTWLPALSNDADFVFLDDASSPITALLNVGGNALIICTRQNIYGLFPTGRIPAFVRRTIVSGHGCLLPRIVATNDRFRVALWGQTELGGVILSSDDVYVVSGGSGGLRAIGGLIRDYLFSWSRTSASAFDTTKQLRPIVYHPAWRQLLIPRFAAGIEELLTWAPDGQAWGRIDLSGVSTNKLVRQQVVIGTNAPRHVLFSDGREIFGEVLHSATPPGGFANATVSTKDFHFGGSAYLSEIFLDWESLTTTATVEVSIAARDQISSAGNYGRDIAPTFASVGSLTDGGPRLTIRQAPVGRFHRLQFKVTAGRVRIRGFQLHGQAGPQR